MVEPAKDPIAPLVVVARNRKSRAAANRKTRVAPKIGGTKFEFLAMSARFDAMPKDSDGLEDQAAADEFPREPPVSPPPSLGVKVSYIISLFAPEKVAHMSNEEVFFQFIHPECDNGAFIDSVDPSLGVTGPASCVSLFTQLLFLFN